MFRRFASCPASSIMHPHQQRGWTHKYMCLKKSLYSWNRYNTVFDDGREIQGYTWLLKMLRSIDDVYHVPSVSIYRPVVTYCHVTFSRSRLCADLGTNRLLLLNTCVDGGQVLRAHNSTKISCPYALQLWARFSIVIIIDQTVRPAGLPSFVFFSVTHTSYNVITYNITLSSLSVSWFGENPAEKSWLKKLGDKPLI